MMSTDKQLAWITTLCRLGTQMKREGVDRVQHAILEHTVRAFEASSGSLALVSPDKSSLTIVAGIDLPAQVVGRRVAFGEGLLGKVAVVREPLLLNGDCSTDPRYAPLLKPREGRRPQSAICWPLLMDREIVGVMSVNRMPEETPFSEQDLEDGLALVNLMTLVIGNVQMYADQGQRIQDLHRLNAELNSANNRLEEAQGQLLQSEKMASIGQLAAGVAHEINNPVGYINSNLRTLQEYVMSLFRLLDAYAEAEPMLEHAPEVKKCIDQMKQTVDLEYLKADIIDLLRESDEGITRVRKIIKDLREFSHVDSSEWQWADLHQGLESTLNIVHNELKYKAEVIKRYGEIPLVECIPSQINQVFMNLLVNAAQAIDVQGKITITTGNDGREAWIDIQDTGKGISAEHIGRVFEPFFTTKPVGKGTGLGLSLSWNIVRKHAGRLEVQSQLGEGTTFRITLPLKRASVETAA